MLNISISNISEFEAYSSGIPLRLKELLTERFTSLAELLARNVQAKLSGEVLESVSGRLKNSIGNEVKSQGDTVAADVFVQDDVPYAAIQEYGGETKAHIIESLAGKALMFSLGGKQAFFKRVEHPGSQIPGRSYLRSSFEEMQANIVGTMREALTDAFD